MNIRFGALIADGRGSVGGMTVTRSKAGPIARTRISPINKRSLLQQNRRAALSTWASYWATTLTQLQRTGWDNWAAMSPTTNKLGDTIYVTGFNAFVRTNAMLQLIGEAVQAAAPAEYGQAGTPTFTIVAEDDKVIEISEPTAPFDKDVDKCFMAWFCSRPYSAGRSAVPTAFQYIGLVEGDSVTAPSFPDAQASPWPQAVDQRVFVKGVLIDVYGRVGTPYIAGVQVTAA